MKQTEANIILIGMPGSGKSTVGALLAKKTGLYFYDLDEIIVQNENMPITTIFSEFGEDYFRNLETKTLKEFENKSNFILSTGGGTVLKDENIEILKKIGKIFYLEISPDEIFDRIKEDKTRPLLQKKNSKEALFKLYQARKTKYELAGDFKVNASNSECEIVDEIYEKINS